MTSVVKETPSINKVNVEVGLYSEEKEDTKIQVEKTHNGQSSVRDLFKHNQKLDQLSLQITLEKSKMELNNAIHVNEDCLNCSEK